uniref:Uncharacterized protein n=1 Tax=Myoviridae sp. ctxym25 TaxID=2825210 RepID=A0A8S5QID6_9CAUD|nr:MAG TPA: hypothetical protein [Myoviridae sp. ctxym25]
MGLKLYRKRGIYPSFSIGELNLPSNTSFLR